MTVDLGMSKVAFDSAYGKVVVTNLRERRISEYPCLFLGFIKILLLHMGLRRDLGSNFAR